MLGKLIKYDLRYSARSLLTMFAVFIGLAILLLGMNVINLEMSVQAVLGLLTVPIMIALIVMYVVSTVSLYRKSLFSDEGYLTLTLPVKSKVLLLSKLLSAFIWGIACAAILLLYVFVVGLILTGPSDVFRSISQFITRADFRSVITVLCVLIFGSFELLTTILFSSCVSAVPVLHVRNLGVPASIISFFLVSFISGRVSETINNALPSYSSGWLNSPEAWVFIGVAAVISLILYFASAYLLDRHKTL